MTGHDDSGLSSASGASDASGKVVIAAETVTVGQGAGTPLLLTAPLSFWGGYDSATGRIIEPGHPQCGSSLAGKVMLMGRSKGSSSSSSVLAEALRNGTGPVAIVMLDRDLIVALGSIVAAELYECSVPIVTVSFADWEMLAALEPEAMVTVSADGQAAWVCVAR